MKYAKIFDLFSYLISITSHLQIENFCIILKVDNNCDVIIITNLFVKRIKRNQNCVGNFLFFIDTVTKERLCGFCYSRYQELYYLLGILCNVRDFVNQVPYFKFFAVNLKAVIIMNGQ